MTACTFTSPGIVCARPKLAVIVSASPDQCTGRSEISRRKVSATRRAPWSGVSGSSHGLQEITATGYTPMQLREYKVTLTGHLRSDATVSQTLSFNVKVRANCLRELATNCDAVPGT